MTFQKDVSSRSGFYRKVFLLVLPMIVQETLTNAASLLDNIMTGRLGTVSMTGIAIASQLLLVFQLSVWGSISGAGVYGAQFCGQRNMEGLRSTFRYKVILVAVISAVTFLIFRIFGRIIAGSFISEQTLCENRTAILDCAMTYINIMMAGFIPFCLTQCFAGTMRETGETVLPMKASLAAILTNVVVNSLLIFGWLGFPRLGVRGAAIASVISRYVELAVILIGIAGHMERYPFLGRAYAGTRIPRGLAWNIFAKSFPLLLNEVLWSISLAALLQCYSVRGIHVVAAMTICGTVSQIFNQFFFSLGDATAIVVGQELGANQMQNVRDTARRMLVLSLMSAVVMGILLSLGAPFIPRMYETEDNVRKLASEFLYVAALCMPLYAMANWAYSVIRAGGRTITTFLFDSGFSWAVIIPAAFMITRYTKFYEALVYLLVSSLILVKGACGVILIRSGGWVKNIVADEQGSRHACPREELDYA